MNPVIIKIGTQGDTSGADKVSQAVSGTGEAAIKAAGLFQDAAGRWRQANGAFASDTQKAAAGLVQLGAGSASVDRVTSSLRGADTAADDFVNSIKAGVGIDLGGRIVNSIAAIPGILLAAKDRGMEFNMTMSNAEVGIANVLAKFMGLDEQGAKREAAGAIQQIIDLEPKAAGGLSDLVQGFMATVAAAQGVGLSVEQNIDLVGQFANALANADLPIQQLGQEMRSILSGNITADSSIAKILGITNEDMKAAKEAGNIYEFLTGKIGALGVAGDSAAVRMSTMESAIDKALGKITEPIFDAFIDGVLTMTDAINSGNGDLEKLGFQIAELVKNGVELTAWATQNSGAILLLGKGVGVLAAAWAAFQITSIISGLTRKTAALFSSKVAIDAETASLARNTVAQAANNAATVAGGAAKGGRRFLGAGNPAGAAAGAVGVGLIGYELLSQYAAGINQKSAESDAIGKRVSDVAGKYAAAIKSAASIADKEKIIADLSADITGLREMATTASDEDAAFLQSTIALLEKNLVAARRLSEEKLKQKEIEATAAKANEPLSSEDQATVAKAAAKNRDRAVDQTAADKLTAAQDLIKKGDTEGAKASLDAQKEYFESWLAKVKADQAKARGEKLEENLDLQETLGGFLQDIADARKDLAEAVTESTKKALQDKIEVETAAMTTRSMEFAQNNTPAAERAKAEEESTKRILALKQQIADLEGNGAQQARLGAEEARQQALQREKAIAEEEIEKLETSLALEKEHGKARIALLESTGAKAADVAKAKEAQLLRELAIEQQIADAKGEGVAFAEKAGYLRDQATADINKAYAEDEKARREKARSADINAIGQSMRGAVTSAAQDQPIDITRPLQPTTDFSSLNPRTQIPPSSVPPSPAAPVTAPAAPVPTAPSAEATTGEAGGKGGAAEAVQNAGKGIEEAVDTIAKELEKTLSGVKAASASAQGTAAAINQELKTLTARLEAINAGL